MSQKSSGDLSKSQSDRNFQVRAICSVVMSILVLVSLGTFSGQPFKVLYSIAAIVAAMELLSFFTRKRTVRGVILAFFEICFLILAGFFSFCHDPVTILATIACIASYDILAYFFGRVFGGKFFPNSRPFPKISKGKTWEGTILGLISSLVIAYVLISVSGGVLPSWLLACGVLALIGDLYESALKRSFSVKDSNEIVLKYRFFQIVELLVGGNEGHGGYLDRLDSFAFTTSVLFLVSLMV